MATEITWISASTAPRQAHAPASTPVSQSARSKLPALWLTDLVLFLPLLGITFFAKFKAPLATSDLLIGIPMIGLGAALGLATGRLQFDRTWSTVYAVMAAFLLIEQTVIAEDFTMSSFALLLAVTLPYALKAAPNFSDAERHRGIFLNISFAIALVGIVQFPAQFIIGAAYAYPMDHFIPADLLSHGYNALNVLSYGSKTYKATGVFLLEPSCYSQLAAVGFTLEFVGKRRLLRLAGYTGAFVVAYSGTGLVVLATAMPVIVFAYRRYDLLLYVCIALVFLGAFSEPLGLDLFVARSGEFSSNGSSAHARYVSGFYVFEQYLWGDPVRSLFGLGAGAMRHLNPKPIYSSAETSWVKMTLEYGLTGALAIFGFVYARLGSVSAPVILRVTVPMLFLLGSMIDAWVNGLCLSLLAWAPGAALASRSERPERPT